MLAYSLTALLTLSVGAKPATVEEAKTFTSKTEDDLKRLWVRAQTAEWIKSTYITDDTEQNAAWANEDVMAYLNVAIKDSQRFKKLKLDTLPKVP